MVRAGKAKASTSDASTSFAPHRPDKGKAPVVSEFAAARKDKGKGVWRPISSHAPHLAMNAPLRYLTPVEALQARVEELQTEIAQVRVEAKEARVKVVTDMIDELQQHMSCAHKSLAGPPVKEMSMMQSLVEARVKKICEEVGIAMDDATHPLHRMRGKSGAFAEIFRQRTE
ncbi:hypothetical protein HYDPIDRAFT_171614 [Hydnomerulius pinastri MD-312]|uniref:Uncharacterized protein n=1 Tax=Hydnomerulius pinastri MD-312 TaxID=994086 RepID=A0A0C9VJL6_9AGAM|nr:hypothetical protein HYDPIDRAFT_171614 [Hydnomerulius pinastri MD-312]